jgi:outer membrane protein assembly factor BamB
MPRFPKPGRVGLILAVLGVLAGLGAGLVLFALSSKPGNISNPDVEFVATQGPAPVKPTNAKNFNWPLFGYDEARTRYLPTDVKLRPPFRRGWRLGGSILLEFPPVVCGTTMFLQKNTGSISAIRRADGYLRWRRDVGELAASSPACGNGMVYTVVLQRGRSRKSGGLVAALRSKDGAVRWSRRLPSRAESSPLLHLGRLYFGTEDGRVYALDAKTGNIIWTYKAGGAVKGALAMDGGKLYFGDYAGKVTALRRDNGRKAWSVGTGGSGPLGAGSGNIYSTPAVAYGRVYLGSTNGFVYSFSARTGQLAWRYKTGAYVYASPAVGPANGGTVYIGSYSGTFYALDARSGRVRFSRGSGGKISGGAVVIGDVVLYSNLGRRTVAMVRADNGHVVWSRPNGGFDPGISDTRDLYLMGYSQLQTWRDR